MIFTLLFYMSRDFISHTSDWKENNSWNSTVTTFLDIIKRKLKAHINTSGTQPTVTFSYLFTPSDWYKSAVHIGDYVPLHVVGLYDFKAERELVVLYPRIW